MKESTQSPIYRKFLASNDTKQQPKTIFVASRWNNLQYSQHAHLRVHRYDLSFGIALETACSRVGLMGLSGLPSLLAVAGLLGFAMLVMLLPG